MRQTLRNLALLVGLLSVSGGTFAQLPGSDPLGLGIAPANDSLEDIDTQAGLPSLTRLFVLALENDSELMRQRYESQATGQEVPMARAALRPYVEAGASAIYQRADNIYTQNPGDYPSEVYEDRVSGTTHDTLWRIDITQPLFSLERWRSVDKALAQADAADLRVAVAERNLALSLVDAYLNAYLASRKLGLLDAKREALNLQRHQAQRAYDLGIGDRINLLEAQSRLDQAVADQVKAENELANALSDLERLTGRLPDFRGPALGNIERVSLEHEWENTQQWLSRVDDNVEVRLAKQVYEVAQLDTDVRRAGHYPELNLSLGYRDLNSSDELRTSEDVTASLELDVPIYRGGYTSASIRQGELTALASREALTNERRLAHQEVRKRLRNLQGNARQLEALTRSIESSQLFLEAAIRGENLGLRDLVDVLDARAELYDLRIQFVEVFCQYLGDRTYLEAATGDLDTPDLITIMSRLNEVSQPDKTPSAA
ncbi:TolC family protein [Modicisalibacter luteus]|uniref:TolC family protein n=1 Tax=Modicisalibacter luteus TaxID=453962 RepID=A0ABV7M5N1_9GAMM|nr:TolC family protein [Halomonas lutea]